MVLTIPRPALVLLIGVSGSGKSTFARQHFHATEIVSSDGCRALVSDDESDQTATADAFELLHTIVEKRLRRGRLTVVDSTSVQGWARASLLDLAKKYGIPAVAIVFDLPEEVYSRQNRMRVERVVEDAVLAQQSANLRESLLGLANDGFARVYVLRSLGEIQSVILATD